MKYVALLRGINVGKSVQVPMKRLKEQFEGIGLVDVATYLNSGNAIFDSDLDKAAICDKIDRLLEREYGQRISTLIKTSEEIVEIQRSIPAGWRNDETQQTYVAYLFDDVADPKLIEELPIKRQYIELIYAHKAIIWNIARANYNKSQIAKIVSHPSYRRMTTRNVNTARRLAELCGARYANGNESA